MLFFGGNKFMLVKDFLSCTLCVMVFELGRY